MRHDVPSRTVARRRPSGERRSRGPAPRDLPADFARIPPGSPQAIVLASVPDTPQAELAVIANSTPTTATVAAMAAYTRHALAPRPTSASKGSASTVR